MKFKSCIHFGRHNKSPHHDNSHARSPRSRTRRGDTLVEVTLAIGVFSMVAIAVVAVVSGSTSSAQSALELTVTREQIDIQAEALRFIQSSYIAGGKTNTAGNELYADVWSAIAAQALSKEQFDAIKNNFLEYAPTTCNELYQLDDSSQNTLMHQKAFIINAHGMYMLNAVNNISSDEVIDQILVRASQGSTTFKAASTYPRIVYYESTDNEAAGGESVYEQDRGSHVQYVEGLYVVAVKDNNSTTIVNNPNEITSTIDYQTAAYYDFYIRSCWYAPGADHPSTISTVIRLQDPDMITY